MARGGYRPGAGRPKSASVKTEVEARREGEKANMAPLDYMLSVMNDSAADEARRDKMAIAAAPYVHAKAEDAKAGKKAERQANADSASSAGKYAVRTAPTLVVNNKK